MAEQEREDNPFRKARKARETAQSFIQGMLRVGNYNQLQFGRENLELQAWLGQDSYRTWEERLRGQCGRRRNAAEMYKERDVGRNRG